MSHAGEQYGAEVRVPPQQFSRCRIPRFRARAERGSSCSQRERNRARFVATDLRKNRCVQETRPGASQVRISAAVDDLLDPRDSRPAHESHGQRATPGRIKPRVVFAARGASQSGSASLHSSRQDTETAMLSHSGSNDSLRAVRSPAFPWCVVRRSRCAALHFRATAGGTMAGLVPDSPKSLIRQLPPLAIR